MQFNPSRKMALLASAIVGTLSVCTAAASFAATVGVIVRYPESGIGNPTVITTADDKITGVRLDHQDRLVACGTFLKPNGVQGVRVRRFTSSLSVDISFGTQGATVLDHAATLHSPVCFPDIQERIVVAAVDDSLNGYVVFRLEENGTVDGRHGADLGTPGKVQTPMEGPTEISSIAFVPGNHFAVTGRTTTDPATGKRKGFVAVHKNAGGTDRLGEREGLYTSEKIENVEGLRPVDNQTQLVIAGTDANGVSGFVERVYTNYANLPEGAQGNLPPALDPMFGKPGQGGSVPLFFSHISMTVDTDDRFVFAGNNPALNRSIRVTRLFADGTYDDTIGNSGMLIECPPAPVIDGVVERILRIPGGNFIIAGTTITAPKRFFTARLLNDGRLDTTYGVGGIALGPEGTALKLDLDPAKQAIVAGFQQQ